ncbi:hypothetical protein MRS44_017669 [Fusarium solani]|uniref:uncharacterized protein n=1 Tax=Fusarium solani TaxID=169388 RepID=UPI0032C400B8|nr:hypothetical protein MRS44_017669 [Fusarium solani]
MSNKGGRPKTHGVHEHFAAAPIPPGGCKFTQLRVRCKYCSKTMAKHVQRQQNHLAKECLGFQQAAGHVDRQPRITTALSMMDRNSKDQLDRAAALAIFKSGKPYTTFEDSGMVEFIQMLNPAYKPPSGDRIASILPEVYQDYRVQVKEILDDADHLNVIFDASDDLSNNRIVNISISIPNSVTFYWKTVNTRNEEHTALNTIRLIQPLLEDVFTREGEDFQDFSRMNAICTDTCSTMRKLHAEMKNMPEFRHCFFILCDSHGLQLLVKDIVESERWASVLKKVTRIITFFKKAKLQLARLRAYQLECYGKQKAFITPAITRWGTQLGAVMSSLANKDALRAYARDAMVLNSLKTKAIKGEEEKEEDQQVLRAILSSINNFEFWHEVEMLAKILQPIENAQRCSERDHSCVGEVIPRWLTIQSKWDALEEVNQDPLINYSELRQWRVQRMKDQTTDIHHFAFALDPRTTIGEGLGLDTMERAHRFLEENTMHSASLRDTTTVPTALWGVCRFRAREGALFGPTSRIYREQPKTPHTPSHYYVLSAWGYFGSMGVKLATLARRVLGSLANSVPSERSFSATNYLHCKLRNRLSPLSTDKATFIYMNSRVLKRLKTVKDNPAEPMVVKNWETVDVARLVKIENAFQDSIVVDGWGWEETDLESKLPVGKLPRRNPINEKLYIDYRYFDAHNMSVLYEFGHGLSYTTFALSDMSIDKVAEKIVTPLPREQDVVPGGRPDLWEVLFEVNVTARNTGHARGATVVQLYITLPDSAPEGTPVRQLRGFEKVDLASCGKQTVSLALMRRGISYWDVVAQQWRVPEGEFTVSLGSVWLTDRPTQTGRFGLSV